MPFERNVFINCPFDAEYLPLLRPLLFTVIYLGLKPRIALESSDPGQARLDKIIQLIRESGFGIHDLSRIEASRAGELFRLNMPFELGIDFGCKLFGRGRHKDKKTLVLEAQPYRYRQALSDLSGADIEVHENQPYRIFRIVRGWLKNVCGIDAAGAARIEADFSNFMAENYNHLKEKGFSDADVKSLPVAELIECMEAWVAEARASTSR